MGLFSKDEFCHVCYSAIKVKKDEKPSVCPACGADVANPGSEVICKSMECEHIKGFLGIGDGEMRITNKRLLWIKGSMSGSDNYSRAGAVGGLIAAGINKNAGKIEVNVPLEDIGTIKDCKKGLRKGITLHTKSGESYNFFCSKPQELKDLMAPYIKS